MKTVIRIEYKDGYGLFFSRIYPNYECKFEEGIDREVYAAKDFTEVYNRHGKFNDVNQDNLDVKRDQKAWFCSYKSIEQLQQWITIKELKDIIAKGYKVLMLDVIDYQEGEHQIVYTKESIMSSKDISSLFV